MTRKDLPPYLSLQYVEDPIGVLKEEFNLTQEEFSQAEDLFQKNLPPLVRKEILPYLFGISHRFSASMSSQSRAYYRQYQIKKASGGYRRIEAPRRFLKVIQRWIYSNILSNYQLQDYVTGFRKGKNIFDNAEFHKPKKNLMVIDIKNFFPSISSKDVQRVFKNLGFNTSVCVQLTGLCTLHGRLPQGAPTSPALSNIVFAPVDLALSDLAEGWECGYSRYADDIAFSSDNVFTREDIKEVSNILDEHEFQTNVKKTRIIGSGGRQILAGLVVNHYGLPPRSNRKKWRAIFHQAKKNPSQFVGKSSKLSGIAAFVNQYDSSLAKTYFQITEDVLLLECNE